MEIFFSPIFWLALPFILIGIIFVGVWIDHKVLKRPYNPSDEPEREVGGMTRNDWVNMRTNYREWEKTFGKD